MHMQQQQQQDCLVNEDRVSMGRHVHVEQVPDHVAQKLQREYRDTYQDILRLKKLLQEEEALDRGNNQCPSPTEHARKSNDVSKTQHRRIMKKSVEYSKVSRDMKKTSDDPSNQQNQQVIPKSFKMSASSRRILQGTDHMSETILDKSKKVMTKKQEEYAQHQKEVAEKEVSQLQATPTINKSSKQLTRTLDDMILWQKCKTSKLDEMRRNLQDAEDAKVTGKPVILKSSAKLVDKRKKLTPEMKDQTPSERLYEYAAIYQEKRRQIAFHELERYSFHPELAPHSKNMPRDRGVVCDRLYEDASERAKRRATKVMQERMKEVFDPASGLPFFQPVVKGLSVDLAKNLDLLYDSYGEDGNAGVHHRLIAKGERYKKKQQAMREFVEAEAKALQNTPKLTETSKRIIQMKKIFRERKKEKAKHSSETKTNPCTVEAIALDDEADAKKLVMDKRGAELYYKKQLAWLENARWKVQHNKMSLQASELEECTFKPSIEVMESDTTSLGCRRGSQAHTEKFYAKSSDWLRRKTLKIEQMKQSQVLDELKECTFMPSVISDEAIYKQTGRLSSRRGTLNDTQSFDADVVMGQQAIDTMEGFPNHSPARSEKQRANSVVVSVAKDSHVLPKGWKEYSTDEGYLYYYHTATRSCQWTFPGQ